MPRKPTKPDESPAELLGISDTPDAVVVLPSQAVAGGAATAPAKVRSRTEEMVDALRALSPAMVSPGELLMELLERPAWRAYLEPFEPGRGQAAAIGRYLRDLGLDKVEHHRVRGSLYDRAELLSRIENSNQAGAPVAPTVAATGLPTGERRRRDDSEASVRAERAGEGRSAADPQSGQVVGWRRRATDLTRASVGDAVPVPPRPDPARAAPPPVPPVAMPPVWVGGASTYGGVPAHYYGQELAFNQSPPEEAGLPLALYWNQIRRHWAKILAFVVATAAVTALLTLRIPKQYESVATLRMDFNQPMLPGVTSGAADDSADTEDVILATEVLEIRQRAVVLEAITEANLDKDPRLLPLAPQTAAATPSLANIASARDNALVGVIQAGTTVEQPTDTRDIEVHFRSHDPNTSAEVANALANAVINHDFKTRSTAQQQALDWMTKQFNDVKARVEQEQQQLLEYEHANNIINPDDKTNIENSRLQQLNSEFLTAQSNRVRLQADDDMVKNDQLDTLLASDQGAVLRPAYDAWRAAQSSFDLLKTRAGPNNPAYQQAQRQLDNAQAQLDTAQRDLGAQIDSDYQKAVRVEKSELDLLNAAKAESQDLTGKAIDFDFLKRNQDADMTLYNQLMSEIKQDNLGASMSSSDMRVTDQATPNSGPVYPSVPKNVTLAILFSLFFGCALAVTVGFLDRSFTSPERVEQFLGIPLLGALPIIKSKTSVIELAEQLRQPAEGLKSPTRSPFAEAVLMLHTAVRYAAPHALRSLSISSAQPQEGKSVTASNLAIAMALHGSKVLLIDADIRRPTLHRIFDVANHVGLSNLLRHTSPLEECFRPTTVEKLYLMPAGPAVPNPSELLATMLPEVLTPLFSEFDFVLVDSPPILGFADATTVATLVEGTLMVARAGKTPRELVLAALQPLKHVRARVLGLVLNQVSSSLSPYYSYYRDHYSRYYGSEERDEAEEMEA